MTDFKDFSLQNVVDNMDRLDIGEEDLPEDVMPQAAQDMGAGKCSVVSFILYWSLCLNTISFLSNVNFQLTCI